MLGQLHLLAKSAWNLLPLALLWLACLAWFLAAPSADGTPVHRAWPRSTIAGLGLVLAMAMSSVLAVFIAVAVSPD